MKRILIIEDELEMLRNLTTILRLEKFRPLSAENGRAGVDLARRAAADWGKVVDNDILLPILILHDVDKPLMYVRESPDKVGYSQLARELQHGVVGAMLLKDLGLPHIVVSTVATHAGNSPFHGRNFEAYVLHYADYFATDHAIMLEGDDKEPYYQKHWK